MKSPLFSASVSSLAIFLFIAAVTGSYRVSLGADERETDQTETKTEKEAEETPWVPKSKAQLRRTLTPMQFKVTQAEGTEPAFRNAFWNNKKPGRYHCVVCDQVAFDSDTKFDSGTGWPSFYEPIDEKAVGYKDDFHFAYRRIEVHCSRCGAHFGHVFDDGPPPTGKRYCMNSASLRFYERKPAESGERAAARTRR